MPLCASRVYVELTFSCLLCGVHQPCRGVMIYRDKMCSVFALSLLVCVGLTEVVLKGPDRRIERRPARPFETCSQVFCHI